MIRLKGDIDWEITRFGVKSGDVIEHHTAPDASSAIFFDIRYNNKTQTCVVWKDNYDFIDSKEGGNQ